MSGSMLHSNLGASSSSRWMNCSGSPSLIDSLDPELRSGGSSMFAEEGSAAHALAELAAQEIADTGSWSGAQRFRGETICQDEQGDYVVGRKPTEFGQIFFTVDDVMVQATDLYAATILEKIAKCHGDPVILVEEMVYPFKGEADLDYIFGTSDCTVIDSDSSYVAVIDYKYGKGIKVSPVRNSQAMFYALGSLPEESPNTATVEIVIVQPRVEFADGRSVAEWLTNAADLREWRGTLRDAVHATQDDRQRRFVPGSYCRFCPASAICPSLQQEALSKAQEAAVGVTGLESLNMLDVREEDLILPDASDAEGIARALATARLMKMWAQKVEKLAEHQAVKEGQAIPGHKLVRRPTRRRWADEKAAAEALAEQGIDIAEISEPAKLWGPAKVEKLVEVEDLRGFMQEHVVKPEGGITLAHETDRRGEVSLKDDEEFGEI